MTGINSHLLKINKSVVNFDLILVCNGMQHSIVKVLEQKCVEEKFQMHYKNAINHLTIKKKMKTGKFLNLCLINIEWGKVETKLNQIGLSLFVPVYNPIEHVIGKQMLYFSD
ncbi:hypothetical protein T08_1760 [Trichinella sp. T8]|nr:hypothetical protein T08_1760 [Trichinella sp. T8]